MTRLNRRLLIKGAAASTAAIFRPALVRAATELVVTVNGGTFEEGWRKAMIEPFEKANPDIKVRVSQGLTFQSLALMRAQKDNPQVDVVMMDAVAASLAAAEGLTSPLSDTTVPNKKDIYPKFQVADDQYVEIYFVPEVLAYNTEVIKDAPKSYEELWNPEYKGRVAVGNIDTSIGLMAFLIINAMKGGTIDNVEPGFAAFKELKSHIVTFPTSHAQISQLFTQGDIVMVPWVSDRATTMKQSGAPIDWTIPKEGAVIAEGTLSIAKGTKNLEAALKYVDYAVSADVQAAVTKAIFVSPVNQKAVVVPDLAKLVPSGPEQVKHVRRPDWKAVNEHRAQWLDRWNREILS